MKKLSRAKTVFVFGAIFCFAILVELSFSYTPIRIPFLFGASSEKIKEIVNSTPDMHASFYDNFQGKLYRLIGGESSPNGKWKAVYIGDGSMGVTRDNKTFGNNTNNYFFEQPKVSTRYNDTSASLVTTSKSFSDFQLTLEMRTVRQLRENSAPAPWETAWVFWHYTDRFHYYGLVLKTNGFQIEKKDNNVRCDCEIYLYDVSHPEVKIGQWQTITLRVTGSASGTPHIIVWVDGVKVADFVDNSVHQPNSPQMSKGSVGLYNEDSLVNFDNVNITMRQ
jgi:3-keto-disaccharide hydrolase